MENRTRHVLRRGSRCQRFEPRFLGGVALKLVGSLELLDRIFFDFVVVRQHRIVVNRRLRILAIQVQHAANEVTRVVAERGIGERRDLVQRAPRHREIAIDETSDAVIIQPQRTILVLRVGRVFRERFAGGFGFLDTVRTQFHLGLIATAATRPLVVLFTDEPIACLVEPSCGIVEFAIGGLLALRDFRRCRQPLLDLLDAERPVANREVVKEHTAIRKVAIAGGLVERFERGRKVLLGGIHEAQREAISCRSRLRRTAELLQKLLELLAGRRQIPLVVRLPRRVNRHFRLLFGRDLRDGNTEQTEHQTRDNRRTGERHIQAPGAEGKQHYRRRKRRNRSEHCRRKHQPGQLSGKNGEDRVKLRTVHADAREQLM